LKLQANQSTPATATSSGEEAAPRLYETEQKALWKVFPESEKCKDQSPKFDQGRKETNAEQGKPEEP
jgi:hypothetical protein